MTELPDGGRRALLAAALAAPAAGLISAPTTARAWPFRDRPEAAVLGLSYAGTVSTIFDRAASDPTSAGVLVLRGQFGGPAELTHDPQAAMTLAAELAAMEGVSQALGMGARTARADAILIAYEILGATGAGDAWTAERSVHVSVEMERDASGALSFSRRVRRVRMD